MGSKLIKTEFLYRYLRFPGSSYLFHTPVRQLPDGVRHMRDRTISGKIKVLAIFSGGGKRNIDNKIQILYDINLQKLAR